MRKILLTLVFCGSAAIAPVLAAEQPSVYDICAGSAPRLSAGGNGALHLAFERSESEAKSEVYYTKSSDAGKHWSAPINISLSPARSSHPDIAVEGSGAIDIVWLDSRSGDTCPDIFVSRSTDNGSNWSAPLDVSNTPGVSSEPALAIGAGDSIHVVWIDTTSGAKRPDVFYSSSADGAKTWTSAFNLSDTPGVSSHPAIAADIEGGVHVAWKDTTSGETRPDIFYTQNKNAAWVKPDIDVSNSARISDYPSLACGKGEVFLAWSDNSRKEKSPDIWCSIGKKNEKFSKPLNISNTPGVSSEPSVTPDHDGRMAVVWTDTSNRGNKADIYARLSVDNLDDISNVMQFSQTSASCKHPDVALSQDIMFVVWQEDLEGKSSLKIASKVIKNIATGPSLEVDPVIRAVPSNSR